MITFESDYTNGTCKEILDKLVASNDEIHSGYLKDDYRMDNGVYVEPLCCLKN